ncbi:serine/threonine-protein kinase [Streptomyces buecherae]|uniref:non-specific serine/threonine protein kinase n=1 Tax=Streptomyces buecherae TaxID=2763006 RepID=A0A7H8NGE3_9ACTN|nr:serine/threonine-protein kinase [Streptomyces buecherae]QKW53521.1 protein kinase [Streptomyces buecherae]
MSTGDGADLTGRVLGGRYRVTRQLGRGGMGVVCAAVDEVLGREVAVKVLRAFTDAGPAELADLRTRMRREARAAARIRHSGVITVHDVAEENELPIIVMELIDGPSLDDVLTAEGVLDPTRAAAIGARVAEALGAGHEAGVLHRDVKPGNVLLDRASTPGAYGGSAQLGPGRVVLTDFGIASMDAPDDGAATKLTRSGELIGSLDYLAPERAQGHEPGPGSDVWALGMTLYAAVEGSSPFRRTSVWSTLTAIVTEPLPEPRRAGPLTPVLWALMAKDPAARPTAAQAAAMLDAVAAGHAAPLAAGPGGAYGAPGVPAHGSSGDRGQRPAGTGQQAPGPGAFGAPAQGSGASAYGAGPAHGAGDAVGGFGGSGVAGAAGGSGDSGEPGVSGGSETVGVSGMSGAGAGAGAGAPRAAGAAEAFGAAEVARQVQGVGEAPGRGGWGEGAGETLVAGGGRATRRLPARRRARRGTLAAVTAATVLAGGGLTYALMDRGSGDETRAGGGSSGHPTDDAEPGAVDPNGGAGDPEQGGAKGKRGVGASASPTTDSGEPTERSDDERDKGDADERGKGEGDGAKDADRDAAGEEREGRDRPSASEPGPGASSQAPASACHPSGAGAGKHDCTVWKSASSYTRDGAQAGTLNQGTNYFFCQENLGRRETSGAWTNVWWAKTDDDSGNAGVYVSVVYVKGGANDQPVPGLPVC